MRREAAMTEKDLTSALEAGIRMAAEAKAGGIAIVAVGEMGIGNTTAASAIAAILTKESTDAVTGKGTGLDDAGKSRKQQVIEESLRLHFGNMEADPESLEILRRVGGLEIAAMTGFILGAAANRMAIVCDGFISTAAAAIAQGIAPAVSGYLFAGHCSEEPGHKHLLHHLGVQPLLHLDMRLGEGTGAVLAMPLIEASVRLFTEMATFTSAGVSTADE
jgi:nicotinate-nucleotide--dimethylbenzimidazole phosphoribosyltransferase